MNPPQLRQHGSIINPATYDEPFHLERGYNLVYKARRKKVGMGEWVLNHHYIISKARKGGVIEHFIITKIRFAQNKPTEKT